MRVLKQSTAYNLSVLMIDSSDHVSGKTGLTLTITASKAGAAFASISPTVTELASGWYSLALTTTHTNTLGDLLLHITATGADPADIACQVVVYDVTDAVRLGLTSLPNANAGASGGLPTTINGNTVQTPQVLRTGTAQAGGSYTITLDSGASATNNFYPTGSLIVIVGGTGAGQARTLLSYAGGTKIATLSTVQNWTTTPDNTSIFVILASPLANIGLVNNSAAYSDSVAGVLDVNAAYLGGQTQGGRNVTVGGYAIGQDPATLVLDVAASGHNTTGTIGAKINSGGGSSAGAGANAVTVTINKSNSQPADGAAVWATTDLAGSNVVASGTTNSNGQVTLYLDSGTYYVFAQLAGQNFNNPQTLTV